MFYADDLDIFIIRLELPEISLLLNDPSFLTVFSMPQTSSVTGASNSILLDHAEQSADDSPSFVREKLLSSFMEWRTQTGITDLTAQHRDIASRQIELFLKSANCRSLDFRGLHLGGLPKEIVNLRPMLASRVVNGHSVQLLIGPEGFSCVKERELYSRFFGRQIHVSGTSLVVTDPCPSQSINNSNRASANAVNRPGWLHSIASTMGSLIAGRPPKTECSSTRALPGPQMAKPSLGTPTDTDIQHRQWIFTMAAVVNAMRDDALPLLRDIAGSLQSLVHSDDGTTHQVRRFFDAVRLKVNDNISKTSARSESVPVLPTLSFDSPLVCQEYLLQVSNHLRNINRTLQNARVTGLHSANNIPKALDRISQLTVVVRFLDRFFDTVHRLGQQLPKVIQSIFDLENLLGELHAHCLESEVIGQPKKNEIVQLTRQLIQQSEALRDVYRLLCGLHLQVVQVANLDLPDGLNGTAPFVRHVHEWDQKCRPKLGKLQLYKNMGLLMGRLCNPNLDLIAASGLCGTLAGQINQLPSGSAYWSLIESHPLPMVRELASSRPKPLGGDEISDEISELISNESTTAGDQQNFVEGDSVTRKISAEIEMSGSKDVFRRVSNSVGNFINLAGGRAIREGSSSSILNAFSEINQKERLRQQLDKVENLPAISHLKLRLKPLVNSNNDLDVQNSLALLKYLDGKSLTVDMKGDLSLELKNALISTGDFLHKAWMPLSEGRSLPKVIRLNAIQRHSIPSFSTTNLSKFAM